MSKDLEKKLEELTKAQEKDVADYNNLEKGKQALLQTITERIGAIKTLQELLKEEPKKK